MSRSPTDVGNLHSDIIELKLLLLNIKDLVTSLETMMELRYNNIVKIIASLKKGQELTTENYTVVSVEFNRLKDEIITTRDQFKTVVKNLEDKYHANQAVTQDNQNYESKESVDQNSKPKRSTIRCSVFDDKKLADNLRSMLLVVANFEKENDKLKEENKKLSIQLFELLNIQVGSSKDDKILLQQPIPKPTPNITAVKDNKETSFTDMNKILCTLKEEIQSTFIVYLPGKSFSEMFFHYRDVSFNWNESETQELTEEEWKLRLNALKDDSDQMAVIDAKLMAIKTVAEQDMFNKMHAVLPM